MKAFIVLTFALVAGLAQAVTQSWANYSESTTACFTSDNYNAAYDKNTDSGYGYVSLCLANSGIDFGGATTATLTSLTLVGATSWGLRITDSSNNTVARPTASTGDSGPAILSTSGGTTTILGDSYALRTYTFTSPLELNVADTYHLIFVDGHNLVQASQTTLLHSDSMIHQNLTLEPSMSPGFSTLGAFTVTYDEVAVPEPGVLALLALGLTGLALKRRA